MAKILVVDDNESFGLLLKVQLQRIGHVVINAANGKQGLQALAAAGVDLIITDIFMPEHDGFEFITEVLRHPPIGVDPKGIKIIAMTGGFRAMNSTFALKVAHKLGAIEIIAKPFPFLQLQDKIENLLGITAVLPHGKGLQGSLGDSLSQGIGGVAGLGQQQNCLAQAFRHPNTKMLPQAI